MRSVPGTNLAAFPRLVVMVGLWCGVGCSGLHGSSSAQGPRIGDEPPPLELGAIIQGPAGGDISWAALRGKVVVLDFWNTRCGPCVEGIPHWNELVEQFASRPVVFLGVSDDSAGVLKRFLSHRAMQGWQALDAAFCPTTTAFGVMGIPHTVIVDAGGRIAAITSPAMIKAEHVEEILAGHPSSLPVLESFSPEVEIRRPDATPSLPESVRVSIEGPLPLPLGAYDMCRWDDTGCRFTAQKAHLRTALAAFHDVSRHLVFADDLLPDGLYDIVAEAPPDQLPDLRRRLDEALAEKWGIAAWVESRDVDVYVMTVCDPDPPARVRPESTGLGSQTPGHWFFTGATSEILARIFENLLERPVVDESGLDGRWDIDLTWEPSDEELNGGFVDPAVLLRAAREQLGLALTPAKRVRTAVVVDRLARE